MGNICNKTLEKIEYLGISQEDGPETEWTRQNMTFKQNPMYRLVYFSGKGTLVAKANKHGATGKKMKKYIKQKIQEYLYRDGDGKELTKLEYAKYMFENNYLAVKKVNKVQMSSEELIRNLERHETIVSFDKFEQHQVCWDLNRRGEVGETILHLCFLNNTEHHRALAHTIMECYPQMALDIYEGPEYYGEGMLHMAIINNDIESVNLLIHTYFVPINQRATGRFFCPKDLKDKAMVEKNLKTSKFEGETYFGEYPLAFAASVGSTEIYDIILNASVSGKSSGEVDPNDQDNFGNTVLHMIVIHNQVHMFNYVASHNKMPANYEIRNKAGLTPMELSFQLGRSQLFSNLLDLASVPQWSFGNITYAAYPLSLIDTIGKNGETNENSALRIIVRGETQEHLEMLDGEIINTLLMEKWKTYARNKFYFKFVWALLHLCLLSIAVYLRPKGDLMSSDPDGGLARFNICMVRWVAEICVLIGCVAKTVIEIREIISRGSIKSYLKSLYMMPAKSAFLISIIMLYLCVPFRLCRLKNVEETFLSILLPFSWCYILFFYRAMKRLGPFIHMIYEMLMGDLLRFSIIYTIFIFMFSQVFFYMYKETDHEATDDTFATAHGSVMSVFKMTLGDFSDDLFDKTEHWLLSRIVFVLFAIYLPILLLNMLIAMMGRTYTKIEQKAKREWRRQLAIIILNVERAISKKDLAQMRLKYSTEITVRRKQKKVIKKSSSRVGSCASFYEDQDASSSRTNLMSLSTLYSRSNYHAPSNDTEQESVTGQNCEVEEEEKEETFRALMFLKRSDPEKKKNCSQAQQNWMKSMKAAKNKSKSSNEMKLTKKESVNREVVQKIENSLPNVAS
ncbi:transient receptor potential cation channel subfamily V member 5-like [Antedon mediterranea]|uniref:transient receptor potential cation channel subfamily V member 5-like n=1 Tax=Antedon mediterranea TaxID=105859 RepID=UPI003AF68928